MEYTRRLVCWPDVLAASDSDSYKVWALIEFAWWCCAPEGNLANTIARMFEAVQYFHRLRMGVGLPVTAPVAQCALGGIAGAHVTDGTPRRVRLPVSFGMLLGGATLIPAWDPKGEVLGLCLCLCYFLMTRSDKLFAADSGAGHTVHFLTEGGVALYGTQLRNARWQQAHKVKVRLMGRKGDQE